MRFYSRHFPTSRDRIHDGKQCGLAFVEGGRGRVEDCKIWGNERTGIFVQGSGSEAVVAGCKCAGGRVGVLCWRLAYFKLGKHLTAIPLFLPPLLNIALAGFTMETGMGWLSSKAARGGWRNARSGATQWRAWELKATAQRPWLWAASAPARGFFQNGLHGSCASVDPSAGSSPFRTKHGSPPLSSPPPPSAPAESARTASALNSWPTGGSPSPGSL